MHKPREGFLIRRTPTMSFFQYIQDTRGEMRHVAWPTQAQTIIYTILVIAISAFAAAYLGLFDFLFTSGLGTVVDVLPEQLPTPQLETSSQPLASPEVTILPGGAETAPVDAPTLRVVPQE